MEMEGKVEVFNWRHIVVNLELHVGPLVVHFLVEGLVENAHLYGVLLHDSLIFKVEVHICIDKVFIIFLTSTYDKVRTAIEGIRLYVALALLFALLRELVQELPCHYLSSSAVIEAISSQR